MAASPNPKRQRTIERLTTIPNLTSMEFAALSVVIVGVLLIGMWRPAPLEALRKPDPFPKPRQSCLVFPGFTGIAPAYGSLGCHDPGWDCFNQH